MRSLERGRRHETLGTHIGRIAYAYGFTASPVALSKKALANAGNEISDRTKAAMALMSAIASPHGNAGAAPMPAQAWGVAQKGSGTVITFAITSTKEAIAHALIVKTALSIAEIAGYTDLSVGISSVGDAESRKRFTRELTNFFRKNLDALSPELRQVAARNPDEAYRMLLRESHPLLARAPRSIDYLSENSRRTMLSALSLFESVGIPYTLEGRLPAEPNIHSEILFSIVGTAKSGSRHEIASGGRYDDHFRRERGKPESAVAIAIEIGGRVVCDSIEEQPSCFVVHVGEQAKLRAFSVLEALWRARISVGQALMAENLREQTERGSLSNTRYLAIIGQRETLDNTVIVRSVSTQTQTIIPVDKLVGYVTRSHRE
ncbi:MAG: hypothetical protein JO026_01420 [Patescibacteria group bacterium]|nr:hypothetical protein [Patescibacteria group bacterium]